jgi:2-polyprenyl-3-methyl-5-hydroxy-6-metoxy-1,4-benzoquinol methylase
MEYKHQLDLYAEKYSTYTGMNNYLAEYSIKFYNRYLLSDRPNSSCLELGCADGFMTLELVKKIKQVVAVDGSKTFLDVLKNKLEMLKVSNILCIQSFFEEFTLDMKFDTIIMGHMLEHVTDPVSILKKYKQYLKKDGIIIADVPNAKSLHRIAAYKMGLIKSIYDLNETDIAVGHKRVYTIDALRSDILNAGLNIVEETGFWLKFLSNKQIEEHWSDALIRAYMDLEGFDDLLPYAANIMIVCSL